MSEHEWVIGILHSNINVYCLTHHDRACMMSVEEAEAMLNEHAALKRENTIRKSWLNEVAQVNLKWAKEIAGHNALLRGRR